MKSNCIWKPAGSREGRFVYTCVRCGGSCESKYDDPSLALKRACSEVPSEARRLMNFTLAVANHVRAGSPVALDDEIDERLAICESCELYVDEVCTHKKCGCPANDREVFRNKLRWAEQKCPLDKWGPV